MKKFAIALALFTMDANAAELNNAEIKQYDCSITTLQQNGGKCVIMFAVEGKPVVVKASPEVGAPWGNSYGEASCHPMSKLALTVQDGEVITVRDESGKKISTKFDYSR